MNKTRISLSKASGLVVQPVETTHDNMQMAMTIQANVLGLRFVLDKDLLNALAASPDKDLIRIHGEMLPVLIESRMTAFPPPGSRSIRPRILLSEDSEV